VIETGIGRHTRVHLAIGTTDLRKAIDGLSLLVASRLGGDPFSGDIFGFCNRQRTMIKLLVWDRNGFWVLHKRLEKERFRWPETSREVLEVGPRELRWLLDGLDPTALSGHKRLEYSELF
jgi:transposase